MPDPQKADMLRRAIDRLGGALQPLTSEPLEYWEGYLAGLKQTGYACGRDFVRGYLDARMQERSARLRVEA